MSQRVLCFGEALWDLSPDGEMLGGAPLNLGYRLHCLGQECCMISRLGQDDYGRRALEKIDAMGMDRSLIQQDADHPTGTVPVKFDEKGVPDFTILPDVAYDYIDMNAILEQAAIAADCLCFGTLIQRAPQSRNTLASLLSLAKECNNALLFLDLNLRKDCYTRATVEASLEKADLVKLSDEEMETLTSMFGLEANDDPDRLREIIRRWKLQSAVVTYGEKGAIAMDGTGEWVYDPGYEVQVVDTCGSGDAFSAGFLYGILKEWPLEEACALGNILGAICATQAGGTAPMSWEDVREFGKMERARITLDERSASHWSNNRSNWKWLQSNQGEKND